VVRLYAQRSPAYREWQRVSGRGDIVQRCPTFFIAAGLIATVLLCSCEEPFAAQRDAMVREQIEARGIRNPDVLRAMRSTPRHLFVPTAVRPHELYVLRGNQSGSELDDWLQAEEEIRRAEEQPVNER